MRKIPKIVHYCWFGNGEKPDNIKAYIETWKAKMPEYTFMEWNEQNFDVENSIPYVRQAYEAKKYAFVSDYARIQALYQHGGIYFDTDIEVKKPFEEFLEDKSMVLGFESERSLLTAFIAVEKEHPYMREFLESYRERNFLKEDGSYDMLVINEGFSALMERKGVDLDRNEYQELPGDIVIYPEEYFCGFDVNNWHESITDKTCTVHYMNSSWVSGKQGMKRKIIYTLQKILGYKNYDRLKEIFRGR
ncbi:MAG: glycosyl transferase [Lachnospiraceae bacterium]|nr:glycosyl transferase [Lachnospiraceae bacterium]